MLAKEISTSPEFSMVIYLQPSKQKQRVHETTRPQDTSKNSLFPKTDLTGNKMVEVSGNNSND